jgi:hypothetical protein
MGNKGISKWEREDKDGVSSGWRISGQRDLGLASESKFKSSIQL